MLSLSSSERKTPSRMVILGSRGFVGKNLEAKTRELGWATKALSSRDLDLLSEDAGTKLGEALNSEDTLVFISALTPDKGRDRKTLLKNLAMADAVCEAIEAHPCAHVVYISSDAVYDDAAHPVRETSACNPSSFHGVMHLARERMLAESCKKAGTPLLIVRPCAIYGAGDTHNSYGPNRFLKTALEKNEISLTGQGEEQRDHLFIDDLISLITELVSRKATGVVNAASGSALSFGEVAASIKGLMTEVKIVNQPRQSPVTHRHFDITELLRNFPAFRMTPFGEGIKKARG
ncbi:MAG: NAD-dependent epimerase/dehydratase family protein [Bdellovibrionota bacterium]